MAASGGEFEYINWLRQHVRSRDNVALGIGDDAAAVRLSAADNCLVAADMLLEGTHFSLDRAKPGQVGRKALAVNLSDIAAMAGRPLFAFVSLALNRRRGREFARNLFAGVRSLADHYGVAVAGGDTNIWDGPLVLAVTVLGEATGTGPVTRAGAQPGDWILATGKFGGSLAGKHLTFEPQVREALQLHESVSLHAMIDVSDGLVADLLHILDESKVGAVLDAGAIPISDAARAAGDGRTPLEHALSDGEDFELLFTVSPADGQKLLDDPPADLELSQIGEIVPAGTREIYDADGNAAPLERTGWEHAF